MQDERRKVFGLFSSECTVEGVLRTHCRCSFDINGSPYTVQHNGYYYLKIDSIYSSNFEIVAINVKLAAASLNSSAGKDRLDGLPDRSKRVPRARNTGIRLNCKEHQSRHHLELVSVLMYCFLQSGWAP